MAMNTSGTPLSYQDITVLEKIHDEVKKILKSSSLICYEFALNCSMYMQSKNIFKIEYATSGQKSSNNIQHFTGWATDPQAWSLAFANSFQTGDILVFVKQDNTQSHFMVSAGNGHFAGVNNGIVGAQPVSSGSSVALFNFTGTPTGNANSHISYVRIPATNVPNFLSAIETSDTGRIIPTTKKDCRLI